VIAAQNDETADRFRALGASTDRVHVTGSLKYDGAQTDRDNPRTQPLRELAGISNNDIVFLAGSTQEPEEQIAIHTFHRLAPQHPRLRLILVPRHPERFDAVARLLDASNLPWLRRSQFQSKQGMSEVERQRPHSASGSPQSLDPFHPSDDRPILLVDTVGELSAWWGVATIAFVGGSFGSRGGQNMIEPAAYGAAVSFGPNTWNFRDIVAALLAAEAAVVVNDGEALASFVRRCLEEPEFAAALGQQAQSLVRSNLGATSRTITLLEQQLLENSVPSPRREAA